MSATAPPGPISPTLLATRYLAAPHCFSTRVGGVSSGPFSSLNLGNPSPLPDGIARDPASNINENLRRIAGSIGCGQREIVQVYQVHGSTVHVVLAGQPTHAGPGDTKADAIITDDPTRLLCVRVADCAPILISSADGRVVAAVHAGWRGVIANVTAAAISAMRSLGVQKMHAAVGPCISAEFFEVGAEVIAEFARAFGPTAPVRPSPTDLNKGYVDLKECLRRQLEAESLDRIEVLPHCTFRDQTLFYSHRRDNAVTGRTGAFIAPRA